MQRLPIRLRLTAIYAGGMAALLVCAGAFVYLQVRSDLDEAVDDALADRAAELLGRARIGDEPSEWVRELSADEAEGTLAQVLSASGELLARTGELAEPVLDTPLLDRARERRIAVDRKFKGLEGRTRLVAMPAGQEPGAPILAVGQSINDRDQALSSVVTAFAIGGPLALLLSSALGYAVAGRGIRPVEAMRRRAAEISITSGGERLPLSRAQDELRDLGLTLNGMLDRLEASFQRERDFVADASHELRTPIAVVKAEIEGVMRSAKYDHRAAVGLQAVLAEADRLGQLAEDLLVLMRSGEGGLPVRREPVALGPLLESTALAFVDRAAAGSRTITVDVPAGVAVSADPLRLRQAVRNLIDNALRYGNREITLRAAAASDGVAIEVTDDGPGFDEEIKERAFERFTRGDSARTDAGAGLGLAIVLAVADAHGGSAVILPDRGGGAVRLWLPWDD